MNFMSVFMGIFAIIGALDLLLGNRFRLGKEFEKGYRIFGDIAFTMLGMIVVAPLIGNLMQPISNFVYQSLHIDPSILPAMFLANDMGAATLADTMAVEGTWGLFNGLVVSTMMGCTFSYSIPVGLDIVKQERHEFVLFGFLCGIITIPIGCVVSGLFVGIPILPLLLNLLPMVILSVIIVGGLLYFPKISIKIFGILGRVIKIVTIIGLILGIIRFLTGIELIKGLGTLEEGALICFNACVVMSGAFPFLHILSKILAVPLKFVGKKLDINTTSALGFVSSLATSVTTFQSMEEMDNKGIVLNAAFAISGAFTFAGHLAFTLSYNADYVGYVIVGKLVAGISAVLLAIMVYKRTYTKQNI